MTLYWDILDSGELAVWYWGQDPATDSPLVTRAPEGEGWSWTRDFPDEVLDLLFEAASDYYADTGSVDFTLFRFGIEVGCERIERRE